MLDKLLAANFKLSSLMVWIGGAGLIGAAIMVTIDVFLRDVFLVTLGGADEISGYIFAISTAFAFPYAVLHRANVRIDALYIPLPPFVRSILDLVALVGLAVFFFPLTWRSWLMLQDNIGFWTKSITPLQTPIAIPQSLWFAGMVVFCLTVLLVFVVALTRLLRGDLTGVHDIAGVPTLDEEMQSGDGGHAG
ncbi:MULTISPECIES: TRAP transporter small permease subunit [Thalassobaculum]|uniref:TRAP transporter small permease protein n=1 Tax=Thalassobaculum litoreum DSM 18839 TaxID=1123362 RepID=A0A8G2BJD8_9PROT|nr:MULTISPECIES: TRAP transporter small permease [Thalassobaculum]SDG03975.1 TRAP-type C4-dicarboxylate transport system, small permease component [Thalassobaculum litoreum DSM 18839]